MAKDDGNGNRLSNICKMEEGSIDWSRTKLLVNSYGLYVEKNGTVLASFPKTDIADDLRAPRRQCVLLLSEYPVIWKDSVH